MTEDEKSAQILEAAKLAREKSQHLYYSAYGIVTHTIKELHMLIEEWDENFQPRRPALSLDEILREASGLLLRASTAVQLHSQVNRAAAEAMRKEHNKIRARAIAEEESDEQD
jgi:hypothetical protein